MKYNFQVGDLFVSHNHPTQAGIIVKFNDKLTYPYSIEWTDGSSGHYKEYEFLKCIKDKSITYFPVVK